MLERVGGILCYGKIKNFPQAAIISLCVVLTNNSCSKIQYQCWLAVVSPLWACPKEDYREFIHNLVAQKRKLKENKNKKIISLQYFHKMKGLF